MLLNISKMVSFPQAAQVPTSGGREVKTTRAEDDNGIPQQGPHRHLQFWVYLTDNRRSLESIVSSERPGQSGRGLLSRIQRKVADAREHDTKGSCGLS